MSSNLPFDPLDRSEFDPLFAAMGRLSAAWAHAELGLDTINRIIHSGELIEPPEKEIPDGLKRKIRYFRKANNKAITDPTILQMYNDLCEKAMRHADQRGRILHGFILQIDADSQGALLGKFKLRNAADLPDEYPISIETIRHETKEVRLLAAALMSLAHRLLGLSEQS